MIRLIIRTPDLGMKVYDLPDEWTGGEDRDGVVVEDGDRSIYYPWASVYRIEWPK